MIKLELGNFSISGFNKSKVKSWLNSAIHNEGAKPGTIQFIILDDNELLELNRTYLNHDTLTDIITFNYNAEFGGISGDIFISYDRVHDNAERYDVSPVEELLRVMIHGILHLLGYDDHDATSKELMRSRENYYLSLYVF